MGDCHKSISHIVIDVARRILTLLVTNQSRAPSVKDPKRGVALVWSYDGEINLSQTKTALHRTRLRFWDHKNFSVLFFYKPERQSAPSLAALWRTETEMIERNFSVFQLKDLSRI
ncbi:hypothetical protein ACP3A9_002842 [Citrobacter amalonaticus]